MGLLPAIQSFTHLVQKARSQSELRTLCADMSRELGFDYFAFVHHLNLDRTAPGVVRISNYPDSLVAWQRANRHFIDDPILSAAQRSACGFAWDDLPNRLDLNAKQRAVLAYSARIGLGAGYTTPMHVPGEFAGSCSFAARAGRPLKSPVIPWLHHVGSIAFEAGRQLALRKTTRARRVYHLSSRQLDCLVLVAGGATAKQAAGKLGLKPDTVEKHIGAAKSRAGVRSMSQLIARSLFDGKITFQDILADKTSSDKKPDPS